MLHIGVVQSAAAVAHGLHHLFGLGGDLCCGAVRHQSGNRQFDQRQFRPSRQTVMPPPTSPSGWRPAPSARGRCRPRSCGDCHVRRSRPWPSGLYSQSRTQTRSRRRLSPGAVRPARSGRLAVASTSPSVDGQISIQRLGRGLIFDNADHIGRDAFAPSGA